MAPDSRSQPSFSRRRKWAIGLNVILTVFFVVAVVVMVNYLSGDYFKRMYLSTATSVQFSPRTASLLRSITNEVEVTIYYDREDPLYSYIEELLGEYHTRNTRISVTTIDYYRDPGAAQAMKIKYDLGASTNRNFVVFDCGGRTRMIDGYALADYRYEQVVEDNEIRYRHSLIAFNGEMMFTAALLAVTSPRPMSACFLQGHGERALSDPDDPDTYYKFAENLARNYIRPDTITLLGTNTVPLECNLLIIAGPRTAIPEVELEKIEAYLNRGGRLLAMFSAHSANSPTGLELLLAKWGVDVTRSMVRDPGQSMTGHDVIAVAIAPHPVTRPILGSGSGLRLMLPRWIRRIEPPSRGASDLPEVTEIVFSSENSVLWDNPATPRFYPMIVAVEKSQSSGVVAEPAAHHARMVVIGDSLMANNQLIDSAGNRDFLNAVVDWLVERSDTLEGVGPRQVKDYRLLMSRNQMRAVQWILLGAMPGGVLLFGGLIWLRRRR